MKIRKATKADARWIGSCHYHCWQETYRGLIVDSYLDRLDEEKNMDRFEAMFNTIGKYQYIVEAEGVRIGFFDISKAREDYAPFEVQGLYIRKAHHGKGYGRLIMEFIKENINGHFYLWCLETNPTYNYYKHMGGKVIDSKIVSIGGRHEVEVCFLF